jgi:gluconokinase
MIIILMGVSGVGKTTVGQLLAQEMGLPFHDGDDFHSPDNIAKMERGEPLTEADRAPWIESLQEFIQTLTEQGEGAVLACSALLTSYRQQLDSESATVKFVLLKGSYELIQQRLEGRDGHFMDPSLLDSQFKLLEDSDDSLVVDVDATPEEIVQEIVAQLD